VRSGRLAGLVANPEKNPNFAGNSNVTQAIGAIGCEADVEDDVVQVEGVRHVGSWKRCVVRVEDEDPVGVRADRELGLATDHAVRLDAADLARGYLHPVRKNGTRPGKQDSASWLWHVGRPADDVVLVFSVEDGDEGQLVLLGMRALGTNLRDHDAGQVRALFVHRLHFETRKRNAVGDLGDIRVDGTELLQPPK
jgi:hypothetical protein